MNPCHRSPRVRCGNCWCCESTARAGRHSARRWVMSGREPGPEVEADVAGRVARRPAYRYVGLELSALAQQLLPDRTGSETPARLPCRPDDDGRAERAL